MTELELLAKDCIENHTHKLIDKPTKQDIYLREESIYIQGYKECEKRMNAQIEKMKRCEICKHHSNMSGCSYHSGCEKKCKENGMELFELKEIKEK